MTRRLSGRNDCTPRETSATPQSCSSRTVSALTSAGFVSMHTSPCTSNRSRMRSSIAADAVQRERGRAAADVDARDLGGADEVGPAVDLGQRRDRVRLDERRVVGHLRVGAVRAAVAAERHVQVERRALDRRRRPAGIRARELPALLGADEVPAHRAGRQARDALSGRAHRYLTIPSTALGRSRCASESSVHAP